MKKHVAIFLILLFSSALKNFAGNVIGGDITWTCAGTGNFVFKLRLHVQCGGTALPATYTVNVFNHPTVTSIPVALLNSADISPTCGSSGTTITCISGGSGAVSEYLYISSPIALAGTPPAGGWIFTFTDCCRAANANLSVTPTTGITLYSKMFPLNGLNTNPCYDSSPDFLSPPPSIICNGYSNIINFDAFDPDLDSINVKWAEPLDDFAGSFTPPVNPVPVAFNSIYAYTNPFPNPSVAAGNVGAVLNAGSGDIKYTSVTPGNYTYALIYESYRCGKKISEVFKECQVVLSNCGANQPPTMSAPFAGNIYETSVVAGALVNFTLNSTETNNQNILWEAYSNEFGTGYTNASAGCTQPPCATLNPVPPSPNASANSITFNWQTDCAHLGVAGACPFSEKTYFFYFTAKDDTCPIPAINNQTVIIHVQPPAVLTSPKIKCVAVDAANNVTLSWNIPPDPANTFTAYQVFSSPTLNGNYTSIATFNTYNQSQYTVPAGAGVLTSYYFVKSFGCAGFAGSSPGDTVRPIILTVNNPANGTAQLFWNAISNPQLSTSCGKYKIYKEFPSGTWTLIDSTALHNFFDTITVCSAQINYRVEICDASGCNSISTVDGDVFMDQVDPVIPLLDSVSINAAGHAILGWEASASADVVAYVIYQVTGGINVPIDTVSGITTTFYNNLASFAGGGSETYLIAAVDSCGNISNLGVEQKTIFLSKSYDVCGYGVTLSWNPYINMTGGGLDFYQVLVSINGSPFSLLATTTTTSYVHSSLVSGTSYCYYVRAISKNGLFSSTSNKQCLIASSPNQPSFIYLKRVTVTPLQQVDVDCYIDNSPAVSVGGIELFRSATAFGPFESVADITYNGAANYTVTDTKAEPGKTIYYYYVVVKDSCDNPSIKSDTSQTILCQAWANDNFTNTITWTDYDMWLGGISSYNIYRSVNGMFNSSPIATLPYTGAGVYSIDDDVQYLTNDNGEFIYYVEASEGPGNPYGFTATSNSNYVHVYRDADIFVPNAFAPRGHNKIFFPVTQYIAKTDYQLMIIDRWGQKIWQTTDDTEGWNGDKADGGVYIWVIQYKNARGEFVEKKGSVTLIR